MSSPGWHRRSGKMSVSPFNRRTWGERPLPREDEVLSSWLVRVASVHGQSLHRFAVDRLAVRNISRLDIDRRTSPAIVEGIAQGSGLAASHIERMTLLAWESHIGCRAPRAGILPWILSRGIPMRSRFRYGQQACVQCLAEGTGYRRQWRLAFVVACERHAVWLWDACPSCSAPFDPMRVIGDPFQCAACRRQCTNENVSSGPFFSRAVQIQQWLLNALLGSGNVKIGSAQIGLGDALQGFRFLLRLDRRLTTSAGRMTPMMTTRVPARIECLDRLGGILDTWPEGMVDRARDANLPRTPFPGEACPRWVLDSLASLRDVGRRAARCTTDDDPLLSRLRQQRAANWRSHHARRLVLLARRQP